MAEVSFYGAILNIGKVLAVDKCGPDGDEE